MGNNSVLPDTKFSPNKTYHTFSHTTPVFPFDLTTAKDATSIGQRRRYDQFNSFTSSYTPAYLNPEPVHKPKDQPLEPREEKILPYIESQEVPKKLSTDIRECKEVAQLIEEYLISDEKYIELEQELALEEGYSYTPRAMYKLHAISIPKLILTHYQAKEEKIECCLSGILTEIQRVYITIDNKLFLWNYSDTTEVCVFEPCINSIEALSLSKPNSEIMRLLPSPSIPFALWIATKDSIQLFGLQVIPSLNVISTDFSIPSNNGKVNKIAVTSNGRVFYGGAKGRLEEISYSKGLSWLNTKGKIVKKDRSSSWLGSLIPSFFNSSDCYSIEDIVVDDSRHILYTFQVLSRGDSRVSSFIVVYDLGAYGKDFTLIQKIAEHDILHAARLVDEKMKMHNMGIVGILPISYAQSNSIQLLLVCNTGVRIYLSFNTEEREGVVENLAETAVLCRLKIKKEYVIAGIKMPPSVIPKPSSNKEGKIAGFVNPYEGVTSVDNMFLSKSNKALFLSDVNEESSTVKLIFISTNESELSTLKTLPLGQSIYNLSESLSCIEELTDDSIISVKEIITPNKSDSDLTNLIALTLFTPNSLLQPINQRKEAYNLLCLHESAKSVYFPITQYCVLTTQELIIYVKPRGVDYLVQALRKESKASLLEEVVKRYGRIETCAMLLNLICSTEGKEYFIGVVGDKGVVRAGIENAKRVKFDKSLRECAKKCFFDIGNSISTEDEVTINKSYANYLDNTKKEVITNNKKSSGKSIIM